MREREGSGWDVVVDNLVSSVASSFLRKRIDDFRMLIIANEIAHMSFVVIFLLLQKIQRLSFIVNKIRGIINCLMSILYDLLTYLLESVC